MSDAFDPHCVHPTPSRKAEERAPDRWLEILHRSVCCTLPGQMMRHEIQVQLEHLQAVPDLQTGEPQVGMPYMAIFMSASHKLQSAPKIRSQIY